jgi:hypothetical protein
LKLQAAVDQAALSRERTAISREKIPPQSSMYKYSDGYSDGETVWHFVVASMLQALDSTFQHKKGREVVAAEKKAD